MGGQGALPERVGSSEGLGLDGERLLMRPMMRRATLFVKALGLEPLRAPALAGHGRVAWSPYSLKTAPLRRGHVAGWLEPERARRKFCCLSQC